MGVEVVRDIYDLLKIINKFRKRTQGNDEGNEDKNGTERRN